MKCPIGCKYCMVELVPSRKEAWDHKGNESIGLNKTACFINRLPGGRSIDKWVPLHLLDGETVGFQGIQDPFDPRWEKDLKWLLSNSSRFAGVILTTKWPNIDNDIIKLLSSIRNVVVVLSLTGLDILEPGSTTIERVNLGEKLISHGIRVHGLIHPWIAGVSNIDWMATALKVGIKDFTVKGFRYSSRMKIDIPDKYLKAYKANDGEEILLNPPNIKSINLPRFQGNISLEEAEEQVRELSKLVVISSSSSRGEVLRYTIKRRFKDV